MGLDNPQNTENLEGTTGDATGQQSATPAKTFSQADLDRIIKERLKGYADYDAIKKTLADKTAAEMSEAEKLQAEIKRLQEEANAALQAKAESDLKALRLEVTAKKKLTPDMASRLTGSTLEELEADADKLITDALAFAASLAPAEDNPKPRPTAPNLNGGDGVGQRGNSGAGALSQKELEIASKMGANPERVREMKKG